MLFCAIDISDKRAKVFPVSFIFDYQHVVFDFHEGVEACVRKQGEGGIGLEGIGGGFWKIVFVANLGQKERGV